MKFFLLLYFITIYYHKKIFLLYISNLPGEHDKSIWNMNFMETLWRRQIMLYSNEYRWPTDSIVLTQSGISEDNYIRLASSIFAILYIWCILESIQVSFHRIYYILERKIQVLWTIVFVIYLLYSTFYRIRTQHSAWTTLLSNFYFYTWLYLITLNQDEQIKT